MTSKYSEQDTESFYDAEDAIYRSFWDKEGSVHWGIFDHSTGDDFLKACANLNKIMVSKARMNGDSKVLDMGCGNGTTAIWLCKERGCQVTGIDLSGVRIGNAKENLQSQPQEVRGNLGFEKASATELPFDAGSFTHVWSQATIYHVHDKQKALEEAYRVLGDGGIFVFDDLIKPKPVVSETTKKYVYDRLLFDTPFSFQSYQDALSQVGFRVLEAQDLSDHLKLSYTRLSEIARGTTDGPTEKYQALAVAYDNTVQAVGNGELGWGLYVCQK